MTRIQAKLDEYKNLKLKIKKEEQRLKGIRSEERKAKRILKFIEQRKEKALSDRQIFVIKTPLERIQDDIDGDTRG